MKISPRGDEWKPIADMLESGEYDSPRSLAQAIVKHAYEVILEREWYLTVVKLHEDGDARPLQVAYGLFASEAEARSVGRVTGRPFMVIPVTSGTAFARWVEELEAAA